MEIKKYSPKETAIFDGIMKLLQNGERLYAIKVQQIADAAGMGKGTLYEYFASREAILANALIYFMWGEIQALEVEVEKQKTFISKFEAALDFAHSAMNSHASGFSLITSAMHEEGMHKALCEYANERIELTERLFSLLDTIIECGKNSGEVANVTAQYARMVSSGMLFTAAALCVNPNGGDWESIKSDALQILKKSLE